MPATALSNGFHLPSALALAMALRLVTAVATPRSVVEWDEHDLRARIHGTVLWPSVVRERIGIKVAADIVTDMQEQLAPVNEAPLGSRSKVAR